MIAIYEDDLRVTMHLDLYGRPHEKFITVTGEDGTLHWSFDPNCVRFSKSIEQKWEDNNFNFERNDMFVKLAEEFIHIIDGKMEATCTLDDEGEWLDSSAPSCSGRCRPDWTSPPPDG